MHNRPSFGVDDKLVLQTLTMGAPTGGPVPDRVTGRCRARAVAAAPLSGRDCSRSRAGALAAYANNALCSALAEAAKAVLGGWMARCCSWAC